MHQRESTDQAREGGLVVRMQLRMEVRYGQFGEFMTRLESVNEVVRARGWVEHVAWAPMSGNVNEVVIVADYADLDSYGSEELALHSDAEFMAKWRSLAELLVQGTARIELFGPAPVLA